MKPRTLLLGGLLVTLLLAAAAAAVGSTHPDGLEYVSGRLGLTSPPHQHAAGTPPHLHTGSVLVRVAATLLVLGLGWGLFWLLRGRATDSDGEG